MSKKKPNDIDMVTINCRHGNICKGIFLKHNCIDNLFTLLDGVVYLGFFLITVCKIQLKNVFPDCID